MLQTLREAATFLVGFLPWILLLVLPSHDWDQLCRAVAICLFASVALSWKQLRQRRILDCATVAFFLFCTASLYSFHWVWLAEHMGIVANGLLAGIIWLTILIGRPFTLQVAREDTPRELWNDERFLSACRSIAIFWGALLLVPTAASVFRAFYAQALPARFYLFLSLSCIAVGTIYTSFFKYVKRKQRQKLL